MDLKELPGKKIRLIDNDGDVFIGYAGDYTWADDNIPEGIAAIAIDYPIKNGKIKYENIVDFNENEIASIEIIE